MIYTIVTTYNAAKWIAKCLNSILNSTLQSTIIIVDNNSVDETLSIIRKYYKSVILIESKINLGFGKGNNLGIKYAIENNADYVFLLNQDAWILPDSLETLVNASKTHDDYYITSPLHFNGKGNALDFNFSNHLTSGDVKKDYLNHLQYLKKPDYTFETKFVNAAFWLIKRECLMEVGVFDPIFEHYGEDNDYANRVRFRGYKIGICPEAIGFHDRKQEPFNFDQLDFKKRCKRRKIPYLIILMNINRPFFSNIITACNLFISEIFNCLKKLKFTGAVAEMCSITSVLFNSSQILKHRKKNEITNEVSFDMFFTDTVLL